jgi:hypothetical protein
VEHWWDDGNLIGRRGESALAHVEWFEDCLFNVGLVALVVYSCSSETEEIVCIVGIG